MCEKIDAPICFEGVVFIEDEEGHNAEVSVTFGYGQVPTAESVARVLNDAVAKAEEATGNEWRLPTPRRFMEIAVIKETGQRMAIGGKVDDKYSMLPNVLSGYMDNFVWLDLQAIVDTRHIHGPNGL